MSEPAAPTLLDYTYKQSEDHTIARFAEYATVEKGLAPLTIGAYQADLEQLCQFLGGRRPVTARHRDMRKFIGKLLSDGNFATRSVCRKVSTFREFFKFLLIDGVIRADPMARIESPKQCARTSRELRNV